MDWSTSENGCGWKSLWVGWRMVRDKGGTPIGALEHRGYTSVILARRDESGRTALLPAASSEDGASGSTWELRNALPLSV